MHPDVRIWPDSALSQLDTADLQEPSEALAAKTAHLKEKLAKLSSELQRLKAIEKAMLASPDQQISLTDQIHVRWRRVAAAQASSAITCSRRGHGASSDRHTRGDEYGSDRSQLANIASQAEDVLGADHLDVDCRSAFVLNNCHIRVG
jgi:hypothetical protein